MALLCSFPPTLSTKTRIASIPHFASSSINKGRQKRRTPSPRRVSVQAFFNPFENKPIINNALKEPVAFFGGMFAGLLRLDLDEEPLKEWIVKTVEASGIKPEEVFDEANSKVTGKEASE